MFTEIRRLIFLWKVIAQRKARTAPLERFVMLPCPFCGSERLRVEYEDIDGWIASVCCDGDCEDMVGPTSEYKYEGKAAAAKDAINQWNRRANLHEV